MNQNNVITAYFMRVARDGTQYRGYLAEIENELQCMQEYAGGLIETVSVNEDISIICSREAVVLGKPLNRALYNKKKELITVLAGNLMAVRHKGNEFISIDKEDIEIIENRLIPILTISHGLVFRKAADELSEWKIP